MLIWYFGAKLFLVKVVKLVFDYVYCIWRNAIFSRETSSQEYVIPLTKELTGKNVFAMEAEDRFPHIIGISHSIRPCMAAEDVRAT